MRVDEGYKRWWTLGSGVRPIVQLRFGNLVWCLGVDYVSRERFLGSVYPQRSSWPIREICWSCSTKFDLMVGLGPAFVARWRFLSKYNVGFLYVLYIPSDDYGMLEKAQYRINE